MWTLIKRIAQSLIGLALLVLLVAAVGWVSYSSIAQAPAVVAAVVTGFAALIGLALQRYFEQRRDEAADRRTKLAPIYEQLLRTFYRGVANGGTTDESELETFFQELAQSLVIWGSAPVILAFNRWRAAIPQHGEASPSTLFVLEELLYAIRTDLGVENRDLDRGDLLRIFINDVDDYLPPNDEITVTDSGLSASLPLMGWGRAIRASREASSPPGLGIGRRSGPAPPPSERGGAKWIAHHR